MAYIGKQPAAVALTASDITDGIISNAKLAQDIMSAETALAVAPAATDEFLVSDAGTLKRVDASLVGRGKILQVVSARTATEATSSSASYADTNLTADITPSSTSNSVLVLVQQSLAKFSADTKGSIRVYRDSTEIGGTIPGRDIGDTNSSDMNSIGTGFSCSILDTPSSTSTLTYKTQFCNNDATGTVAVNYGSGNSYITLMEVAG